MATRTKSGYPASRDQLLKRLHRIRGQIDGIARMVEEERYCIDVLTQISAAQGALDRVALGLLDDHARNCLIETTEADGSDRADELMGAIGRLLRS